MRLIRSADLRSRLGLGQVDTLVLAADVACDETTAHVENDLRTPLLQSDYADYYFVQPADRDINKLMFKLSAGFVDAASFHIGTGWTRDDALADTSLEEDAVLAAELGLVTITDCIPVLSRWVAIRYTAGFPAAASPNTDEMFDLANAPDWLQRVAEMKAIALIADSPELDNKDGTIVNGKAFSRAYGTAIERHIRFTPDARLPTV